MSTITRMPDGYGGHVGDRSPMPGRPGSHVAYARGSELVVEWYNFGDAAPYEAANLLIFDRKAQIKLASLIGVDEALPPHLLSNKVAGQFESYFEVRSYAEQHALPFRAETDFTP